MTGRRAEVRDATAVASPTHGVQRTAAWVDREYGQEKWPGIERLVETVVADEADLGRVVGRVARLEAGEPLEPRQVIVDGEAVTLPNAAGRGAYQQLVVDAVLDACTPETDLVIELGSGWGRNLLLCWLQGGPDATYVGAEYTEAGRRVAARLAGLDRRLRFESVPFDYHAPELDFRGRHVVVFTAHSVEQIPQLKPEVIELILSLGERVRCLHFEPVGWQLTGGSDNYAVAHDYNRNLASVVPATDLELVDVIGNTADNATSVIRYGSARS
jgi:hypothetical protein